jgi:hypothetical protein
MFAEKSPRRPHLSGRDFWQEQSGAHCSAAPCGYSANPIINCFDKNKAGAMVDPIPSGQGDAGKNGLVEERARVKVTVSTAGVSIYLSKFKMRGLLTVGESVCFIYEWASFKLHD